MGALESGSRDEGPFAVIDLGSNSARMIVFRMQEGRHLEVLEDARAPLRLARVLRNADRLGPVAIDRTIEALRDFRAIADGAAARRLIAVATSAVREASDADQLLARAREIGIPLQVIDGDTEARLGFVGAVHDLPVVHGATMDVGGGTTELTRFVDRRLEAAWTFPLGSLRLADRFLGSDPPSDRELRDARRAIEAALADSSVDPLPSGAALVGIGGTVRNLAKIDRRRSDHPLPILHAYEVPKERIDEIVDDLASRPAKRRSRVRGLNPDRADSIVAGGMIVSAVMEHVGADHLMISSRGLREGLAMGGADVDVPDPAWVRTISVVTLAGRFATWDPHAAARREALAGTLHEALDPDASPLLRELVSHAATVLDVGRAIDYYDRFEHAAAIVTTGDLAGFTHDWLGLLTAILRQAGDDERSGPLSRLLPKSERPRVLRAAISLALADELNRRIPSGRARPFACGWEDGRFAVRAPVSPGWRPGAVGRRFRAVFRIPLAIEAVPQEVQGPPALSPD
jgi:exopolyphosphatase/guanosine-5'-triphosphate,3'-diphosphate pyrophosphatase